MTTTFGKVEDFDAQGYVASQVVVLTEPIPLAMPARRGSPTQRMAQFLWVCAALWCLVMPRALVLCTGPHCQGSIEFVHAPGSCGDGDHASGGGCCAHAHSDDQSGERGDGDCAEPNGGGCSDVAVAIDEGPQPQRITFEFADAPLVPQLDTWLPYTPRLVAGTELTRTTGPPRADQRTQLLATTVLRV
jgi:hypothetical protein